jgi:hypothetical protein
VVKVINKIQARDLARLRSLRVNPSAIPAPTTGNGTGTSVVKLRVEPEKEVNEYVPERELVSALGKLKLVVVPSRVNAGEIKAAEIVPASISRSARVKNRPESAVKVKSKLPVPDEVVAISNESTPGVKNTFGLLLVTSRSNVPRLQELLSSEPRVPSAHSAAWAEEMPKAKELAVARAAPARSPLGEKTVIRLKGMCKRAAL